MTSKASPHGVSWKHFFSGCACREKRDMIILPTLGSCTSPRPYLEHFCTLPLIKKHFRGWILQHPSDVSITTLLDHVEELIRYRKLETFVIVSHGTAFSLALLVSHRFTTSISHMVFVDVPDMDLEDDISRQINVATIPTMMIISNVPDDPSTDERIRMAPERFQRVCVHTLPFSKTRSFLFIQHRSVMETLLQEFFQLT